MTDGPFIPSLALNIVLSGSIITLSSKDINHIRGRGLENRGHLQQASNSTAQDGTDGHWPGDITVGHYRADRIKLANGMVATIQWKIEGIVIMVC